MGEVKVRYLWNGRPYASKASAMCAQWKTFHRARWYASRTKSEKKYPDRVRARKAVQAKVRRGFMLPASAQPCWDCKGQAVMFDHYLGWDWKHRFAVQAICKKCDSIRRYGKKKS
jgi:hypothetical protein